MATELRGFRNMVVWGRGLWNDEPVWEINAVERKASAGEDLDIEAIEHIIEHTCPKCGAHITWEKALPSDLLKLANKESYGAGYYQIYDGIRPLSLSEDIQRRLERLRMEFRVKAMFSEKNKNRLNDPFYYEVI
jgi:hypothetical protein